MSFFRSRVLPLLTLLSLLALNRPAWANLRCSGALVPWLQVHFVPYKPTRRGDFPPWSFTKPLLEEEIPETHRQQLQQRYELIDAKKPSTPYITLVKRFQRDQVVWPLWLEARNRFSLFSDETSAEVLLKDYVEQDLMIYRWILEEKDLTLNSLLEVHKIVMKSQRRLKRSEKIDYGELRRRDLLIAEDNALYTKREEVEMAIRDYFVWFNRSKSVLHPLELAAQSYRWISSIQPFANGNKRMARWVANWILIKNGFPPLVYTYDSRFEDTLVFGTRSYEANPRPWDFISGFLSLVERSISLEKELFLEDQP